MLTFHRPLLITFFLMLTRLCKAALSGCLLFAPVSLLLGSSIKHADVRELAADLFLRFSLPLMLSTGTFH